MEVEHEKFVCDLQIWFQSVQKVPKFNFEFDDFCTWGTYFILSFSKQKAEMIRKSKKPLDFFIKVERIWKKDDPQAVLKAKREYMGFHFFKCVHFYWIAKTYAIENKISTWKTEGPNFANIVSPLNECSHRVFLSGMSCVFFLCSIFGFVEGNKVYWIQQLSRKWDNLTTHFESSRKLMHSTRSSYVFHRIKNWSN